MMIRHIARTSPLRLLLLNPPHTSTRLLKPQKRNATTSTSSMLSTTSTSSLSIGHVRSNCVLKQHGVRAYSSDPYDGIFEEPVFEDKRKFPVHELVDIRVQGYDYVVVEKFQMYVRKLCGKMGLKVAECWATPSQVMKVVRHQDQSGQRGEEFELRLYERNVQILELDSVMAPVLIDMLQSASPAGVRLTLKHHTPEDTDVRYIPDQRIRELEALIVESKEKLRLL